ncbi:hypothetical protein QZH41_018362 [Actinostola sp. cb2023]|nr:hypothetical protein QZH41_018362 [Actinostola sp. cb2023]
MSFKRVADDFDDFNLHRKRRVNDLLLDTIPCDEVFLMANGKLACIVCRHRPVFDTTAMLSIHRNGKKHITNALVKLERAKEDAEIIQRREHESYLKANKNGEAPLLGITKLKKELALNDSHQSTNDYKKPVVDHCGVGHSTSTCVNKPFFKAATNFMMPLQKGTSQSHNSSCTSSKNPSARNKRKDAMKDRFLSINPLTKQKCDAQETCDNEKNSGVNVRLSHVLTVGTSTIVNEELSEYEKLDNKSKALYISKLRQLGWVMGLDGKWQKDENAEFDSDEDEPPSPKSVLKE